MCFFSCFKIGAHYLNRFLLSAELRGYMVTQRFRNYSLLLKMALLLLMIYTAYLLLFRILHNFVFPTPLLKSKGTELIQFVPSFMERLKVYSWELFFMCTTAICEIILWRWFSKRHHHAWNCFILMIFAGLLQIYIDAMIIITVTLPFWQSIPANFFSELIGEPIRKGVLWVSSIIGLVGLWLSRREYNVKRNDLWQIIASIVSALSIVLYIGGHAGGLDWEKPVPFHINSIVASEFGYFFAIFILCLSSYLLIQVGLRVFKTKSDEK
jgi:hypothetical protein